MRARLDESGRDHASDTARTARDDDGLAFHREQSHVSEACHTERSVASQTPGSRPLRNRSTKSWWSSRARAPYACAKSTSTRDEAGLVVVHRGHDRLLGGEVDQVVAGLVVGHRVHAGHRPAQVADDAGQLRPAR